MKKALMGLALLGLALSGLATLLPSRAQDSTPGNAVELLQQKLDSGAAKLDYASNGWGYLESLLRQLQVPQDSQVLVFSKTSLQQDLISPKTPRAVYFGDNIAVGSVPNGKVIELLASDASGDVAFYTLDTVKKDKPHFERQSDACLACHGFVNRWAPGMIVANVTPMPSGEPIILQVATLFDLTDSRTPFDQRWGGWYVTGTHGDMKHRGNVVVPDASHPEDMPPTAGLNITDLHGRFDVDHYLKPSSDIVALMTLEHQSGFTNLVTEINGEVRSQTNAALPVSQHATEADISASIESLVAYMTFADEALMTSPIKGVSSFTTTFPAAGPRDPAGRSLRDFDLQTRLFRYPLSFMVYSRIFDSLDPAAKARVWRRLYDVLRGADRSPPFAQLKDRDGAAAIAILAATKPGLPAFWRPLPAIAGR